MGAHSVHNSSMKERVTQSPMMNELTEIKILHHAIFKNPQRQWAVAHKMIWRLSDFHLYRILGVPSLFGGGV